MVNTGNGDLIVEELARWPELLRLGGCFPMFDHALQPDVGYEELCRCMTRLHAISGSDLGFFPRS